MRSWSEQGRKWWWVQPGRSCRPRRSKGCSSKTRRWSRGQAERKREQAEQKMGLAEQTRGRPTKGELGKKQSRRKQAQKRRQQKS